MICGSGVLKMKNYFSELFTPTVERHPSELLFRFQFRQNFSKRLKVFKILRAFAQKQDKVLQDKPSVRREVCTTNWCGHTPKSHFNFHPSHVISRKSSDFLFFPRSIVRSSWWNRDRNLKFTFNWWESSVLHSSFHHLCHVIAFPPPHY